MFNRYKASIEFGRLAEGERAVGKNEKSPLSGGLRRENMGGVSGSFEYIPMTEKEEVRHQKMLRRQRLLGMRVPSCVFMTPYEWQALNGWHGKDELMRYTRYARAIVGSFVVTMALAFLVLICFASSLLWSHLEVESSTPLQGQEQTINRPQEHRQGEQDATNQLPSEKVLPVPPYMMPGIGPRMKF